MTDILNSLNWVDVIIAVALLRGAYIGYKGGLLVELLRFIVHYVAFFCAYYLSSAGGQLLQSQLSFLDIKIADCLAGVVIFLAALMILKLVSFILLKIVKQMEGKLFKIMGLGVAIFRTAFALSVILMAIQFVDIAGLYDDVTAGSFFVQRIVSMAPMAFELSAKGLPPAL